MHDLRAFLGLLEQRGELVRIGNEVDPILESTSLCRHVLINGGPALLMGYQILPGIRYWVHRNISVLAQAGLGGEYLIRTGSGATVVGLHTLVVSVGPALVL